MTSYVLILTMIGNFGGGVATATFDDIKSCMEAGEKFLEMGGAKVSAVDYRCVPKGSK